MSTIQSTITVVAQGTGQPLSGVSVFANGTLVGTTNSSGAVNVFLPTGTSNNTVSAKFTGYTTGSNVSVAAGSSFTISLSQTPAVTSEPFTLIISPDSAAVGAEITFSNGSSSVAAAYVSGGLTVNLTPGPQNITGTVPGYQAISASFDSSQTNTGTIQLVANSDTGQQIPANSTPPAATPSTAAILPTLTPEQSPEFVAPDTGQGTYFTMTQARMYIGGLFIDELNTLQFALQDNKIPIYGYASRFYDALGQGKSLVQGQFAINFISEGYLYLVLQEYEKMQNQSSVPINAGATAATQQAQSNLTSLVNALQNPDPAWTPAQIAQAKAQIQSYAASLGPNAVSSAKAGIGAISRQQINDILQLPGGDYPNGVYQDISFDIVIQYTGAGRTVVRRLEQCTLISNESIMAQDGTPILDSYGFIARRLR